jgi:predicted Zn-dependent peptidase
MATEDAEIAKGGRLSKQLPTYPIDDGFTLRVLPAPAFKSVGIHLFLHQPLGPDTTANALLPSLLRRGCRRAPTQRAIADFLERLYGASLSADVVKFGERHALYFHIEAVHDRFAPGRSRILREALGFLRRLITAPVLERGVFPAGVVRQEKDNQRHLIEGLINDRAAWATQRCIEAMCPDEPYRRYEYGSLDELDAATPASLRERHLRLLREAPIDAVVTGPVQGPEIARAVAAAFRLRGRAPAVPPPTGHRPAPPEPRRVVERAAVEQGRLVVGLRTGVRPADPGADALTVCNGILGAFPHSKLFRNVREREGLAYDARSWLDRSKGLLFIQAGIDPARHDTARDVILEQVEDIRNGRITDEEWDSTRKCLFDRLLALPDSPGRMTFSLMEGVVNNHIRPLGAIREAIDRVTRDDVMRTARAMAVDTFYFLTPA